MNARVPTGLTGWIQSGPEGFPETAVIELGRARVSLQDGKFYRRCGSCEEDERSFGPYPPETAAVFAEALAYLVDHGVPHKHCGAVAGRLAILPASFLQRLYATLEHLNLFEGHDRPRLSRPPGISNALGYHLNLLSSDD